MMQKLKYVLVCSVLIGLAGLSISPIVRATAASDACDSVKLLDSNAKCDDKDASQKAFNSVIQVVINVFSIVVGTVSVIMIIIGGFRYVISGGDSSATKAAKDTILYAVIGLVVVIFAQVIVRFVITNATNKPAAPAPPKKTTYSRVLPQV